MEGFLRRPTGGESTPARGNHGSFTGRKTPSKQNPRLLQHPARRAAPDLGSGSLSAARHCSGHLSEGRSRLLISKGIRRPTPTVGGSFDHGTRRRRGEPLSTALEPGPSRAPHQRHTNVSGGEPFSPLGVAALRCGRDPGVALCLGGSVHGPHTQSGVVLGRLPFYDSSGKARIFRDRKWWNSRRRSRGTIHQLGGSSLGHGKHPSGRGGTRSRLWDHRQAAESRSTDAGGPDQRQGKGQSLDSAKPRFGKACSSSARLAISH